MQEKINRAQALKRIFVFILSIGIFSYLAKKVFADRIFRGANFQTGVITEYLYYDFETGGLTLRIGETGTIILDQSLSADERWSGITTPATAGATLAVGDLCYLDVTATEWLLADADAAATSGSVTLGICVLASTDGQPTTMFLYGTIRSAAFPASIALGAPVYVSTTAGDITATQPTGTDDVIRVVGHAITAEPNTILFSPSPDYITHI